MSVKVQETITFNDFQKIEIRVGTIVDVQEFPEARRPAYKLWVDFGQEFGIRKTSAQVTKNYTKKYIMSTQYIFMIIGQLNIENFLFIKSYLEVLILIIQEL